MVELSPSTTKATLGLTGLTVNAMALIAPGAFLWLTFQMQSLYGAPMAGCAMWFGILAALLLCFATAISYAELSKLFPGAGSSYLYAEQAFLSKTKAYRFARVAKFFTGWASHLYYWVYPGCMVGVTAILAGTCRASSGRTRSAARITARCSCSCSASCLPGVGYIAFRGVNGSTGVNVAINIIQISALIVFSIIAIAYRTSHPEGSAAIHLSNGTAINYNVEQVNVMDDKGKPVQDTNLGRQGFRISVLHADVSLRGLQWTGQPIGDVHLTANSEGPVLRARLESELADSAVRGEGEWRLEGDYPGSATVTFSSLWTWPDCASGWGLRRRAPPRASRLRRRASFASTVPRSNRN